MASKAEEYWAHAAECDREADRARDPEVKRQYRQLAIQWRTLAVDQELREQN